MEIASYEIRQIPESYEKPETQGGKITQLMIPGYQHAAVYLPFGYEHSGCRYNTFYLIHGGGNNPESWFGDDGFLKNLLDHMITRKEIPPMIVVAPTYYKDGWTDLGVSGSHIAVKEFSPILRHTIIPLIDRTYRTMPDRKHRAIGGFSMGGVTTWFAFLEAMDLFSWFMPLSGDCWAYGELGGSSHAAETAQLLAKSASGKDFFLYAMTGTEDIAFPNLNAQMEAMKLHSNEFRFGENTRYGLLRGGKHNYTDIRRYICHALPEFFRI